MTSMISRLVSRHLYLWFFLMLVPTAAFGQATVDFKLGQRESWVGQPLSLRVEITNAESHEAPVIPTVEGASLQLLEQASESSFTQIVNGRMTRRSTVTYTIRVTPERVGIIEVPSISVIADGETFQSRPWRLVASRSEVGDLMFVQVLATPTESWVGEPVTLTLQIWLKQYRDPELGVALEGTGMWGLIDEAASNWGIFQETLDAMSQERKAPRGREIDRDGIPYFLFEISVVRHPVKPGTLNSGAVQVIYQHPTGLKVERDFFGRREVAMTGSRPILVKPEQPSVRIRPLPTEGRPAGFTGAVGRFRVRSFASPTEVAVGDPITLVLEVTDISGSTAVDLANLRPPNLRLDSALDGFRVPDTPTTGVTNGRTKVFTETLRPERDDLQEIPGIAFASFDPELDRYLVERTDPIPLVVSPSERLDLATTVMGTGDAGGPTATRLTTTSGVLRSNRSIDDAIIGHVPLPLGWPMIATFSLPPSLFAIATVARLRRRHLASNPHLIRASTARSNALARLEENDGVADRVHHALCGIVAARLHRTDATMTTQETVAAARAGGLADEDQTELAAILSSAEAARYAPGDDGNEQRLIDRAIVVIEALDRLRPTELAAVSTGGAS